MPSITNVELRTRIAEAVDLGITATEMVALLDRAIAVATRNGLPTVSYSVGGQSRSIGLSEAQSLREYYSRQRGGGLVIGSIGFGHPSRNGGIL